MRVLWTATVAVILGCSLTVPVLGVQGSRPGSAESMSAEFWAIVAVGGGLGAIGVSCLVMLVGLTRTVGDVRERLKAVEVTLKLRDGDDVRDGRQREWALAEMVSAHLSHERVLVIKRVVDELAKHRDPPL